LLIVVYQEHILRCSSQRVGTLHSSWLGDNFGEYVCEDDVLSITLKRVSIGGIYII